MRYTPQNRRPEPTIQLIGVDETGKEHDLGKFTEGEAIIAAPGFAKFYERLIKRRLPQRRR